MQSKSKTKTQPPGEVNASGYYANLKQTQKEIENQEDSVEKGVYHFNSRVDAEM